MRSARPAEPSVDAKVGDGEKEKAALGDEEDAKLTHSVFHLAQLPGEHSGLLVRLLHGAVLQHAGSPHSLHVAGKHTLLPASAVLVLEHGLHLLALRNVGHDGHLEPLALQLGLPVHQGPHPHLCLASRAQDAIVGRDLGGENCIEWKWWMSEVESESEGGK